MRTPDTPIIAALRRIENAAGEMVNILIMSGMPIAACAYAREIAAQIEAIQKQAEAPPLGEG